LSSRPLLSPPFPTFFLFLNPECGS
jgi:hypothetical protein